MVKRVCLMFPDIFYLIFIKINCFFILQYLYRFISILRLLVFKFLTFCFSALVFMGAISPNSFAQSAIKQANSPFSKLGFGTMFTPSFSAVGTMGGLGYGYRNLSNINMVNPAALGALRFTTLETEIGFTNLRVSNSALQKSESGEGNIRYFAFGFPLRTKYEKQADNQNLDPALKNALTEKASIRSKLIQGWGLSFGLMPFNSRNYDLTDKKWHPDLDTITYRFVGSGQSYQFFAGTGYTYKGFSAGGSISYVFGTLRERSIETPGNESDANLFSTVLQSEDKLGSFIWRAGLQYQHQFDNSVLTFGVAGHSNTALNSTNNAAWYQAKRSLDQVLLFDTAYTQQTVEGQFTIPQQIGFGVAWQHQNRLRLMADMQAEQWSQFAKYGQPDATVQNSQRYAFGFEYVPDPRAITKLFRSTQYRFGAFYHAGNLLAKAQPVKAFGASVGLGLPLRRNNSRINLAVEFGQRGNHADNGLRETYVMGKLGLTLSDIWFRRYKYE